MEPVILEQRRGQPALVRHVHAAVLDLPRVMRHTFSEVLRYLAELDEAPAGLPFAAYHNMDLRRLDLEIGFPVARPLPRRGDLEPSWLPGGAWAKLLHVGPYDASGPTYDALDAWISQHGHTPSGVAYEFYLSGPDTPPADTRTWIMLPLKAVAVPKEAARRPNAR